MGISTVLILIILFFAIVRIRKFSKMLAQNEIFANECLMICHLTAFTWLTLMGILFLIDALAF